MQQPLSEHKQTLPSSRVRTRLIDWLLILSLAGHFPAFWLSRNMRNQPDIGVVYAAILALTLISVISAWVLERFGMERRKAVGLVAMALVVFWYWPSLTLRLGPLGPVASGLVIAGLLVAVGSVHGHRRVFRLVVTTIATTAFVVFSIAVVVKNQDRGELHIERGQPAAVASPADAPDIFVVVFDGMARSDVLASLFDYDDSEFRKYLSANQFQVAARATANYSITHFSLASTLEMKHLIDDGAVPSPADFDVLQEIGSGNSAFVETLRRAGYSYIHGGHGWWGTECRIADRCLPTPGVNKTLFELLYSTPVGPLVSGPTGSPATANAIALLETLSEWDSVDSGVVPPRLVFLHVGVPHPPLFLDSECRPRVHDDLNGYLINANPSLPDSILDVRRQAYAEQIECAHHIARKVVEIAPPDAVIVFMSDHGPDSLGQLQIETMKFGPQERWERLSALAAARLPAGCDLPDEIALVNLLTVVLNCSLGTELPLQSPRYYLTPATSWKLPVVEISDPDESYSARLDGPIEQPTSSAIGG